MAPQNCSIIWRVLVSEVGADLMCYFDAVRMAQTCLLKKLVSDTACVCVVID